MGKIKYDTQANSRSLLYQLDLGEALDTVVKGMLDNNRIPGILQPVFSQVDDDSFFRYDVTGLVEFQELLNGSIRLQTLIKIMLGIAESLDLSQEYLIPGSAFLLEPEYVFVDQHDLDTGLICLPVLREDQDLSYCEYFLDLMTHNVIDSEQHAQYHLEIFNYLNKNRLNFSLRDFCNLLQKDWDEIQVSQGGGGTSVHKTVPSAKPTEKKSSVVIGISEFLAQRANSEGNKGGVAADPPTGNGGGNGGQKGPSKKPSLFGGLGEKAKDLLGGSSDKNKESKPQGGKGNKNAGKKPAVGGFIPGKGKPGGGVSSAPPPAPRPTMLRPEEREEQTADPILNQAQAAPAKKHAQTSKDTGLSFGKTVFISGMSQGTQIIESPRQPKSMPTCRLIRESTGEVVNVNRPVLRIGRDRDYADYCIEDNGCVSAQHARLEYRDSQFVLLDTKSSNGTFVNGHRLGEREVYVLKDKDVIVFGNEKYTFQME